jgi:hypothetical protein
MPDLLDLQEKLQDTSAAIARIQRAIVANPNAPSLIGNLRSLQKRWDDLEEDFRQAAHHLELDVCHYRILFEDRPTLAGLTSVWGDFQKMFSLVYDALKNGPKLRARLGPDILSETALGFAYSYPGSVGIVLTLNNERLLVGGSLLDEAIQRTLELVHAPDTQSLALLSKRLGAPPIVAAYEWADAQIRFGMTSDVEWRRQEQVRASLLIQKPELERFRNIASETSTEEKSESTVNVELVGADARTHAFHLRLEDDTPIRGRCSPEVIDQAHSVELPASYRATLVKTTKIKFSTEEPDISWYLTRLEKL